MEREQTGIETQPVEPTARTVEALVETVRRGDTESILDQERAVMELWHIADGYEGDVQSSAIQALSELATEHDDKGIRSLALDRLDRVAKEAPSHSSASRLARSEIKKILS